MSTAQNDKRSLEYSKSLAIKKKSFKGISPILRMWKLLFLVVCAWEAWKAKGTSWGSPSFPVNLSSLSKQSMGSGYKIRAQENLSSQVAS